MILVTMKVRDGYPRAEKMVPIYLPENTEADINGWLDAEYEVELSVNITGVATTNTVEEEVVDDDF